MRDTTMPHANQVTVRLWTMFRAWSPESPRRTLTAGRQRIAGLLTALAIAPGMAFAQTAVTWPSRPIKLMVP